MSLPLRHALENVNSLDRVLEDLLVRFIINCPPEDLSSVERELFHFEEASWFYTDFIKLMNQNLPTLKIKSLSQLIIKICPLIWKWDIKADEALAKFSKYKKTIPVRGAAIFNEDLNKILLVKGTESDSWSFPRGKISKDEDDVDCCIREVKEEIGFDLSDYIDEDQFIERNISAKNYKIYLIKNVSEEFTFQPQVRNEIEKIKWFDFKTVSKNIYRSNSNSFKYYLINSMIRPISMWVRHQKQVKNEDQLKQYAEEQLKLLLGITKEEQIDPGRDLLNMLHSAVQSHEPTDVTTSQQGAIPNATTPQSTTVEINNKPVTPPTGPMPNINLPMMQQNSILPFFPQLPQQPQQQPGGIRAMGFQPFAPFGFNNSPIPTGVPQPFLNNPVHIPGYQMNQMPFPSNGNEINNDNQVPLNSIPSTPNIQSLSKPSLVTASDEPKSNDLLTLLKNPQKTVSHLSLQPSPSASSVEKKPKMKILKRGEDISTSTAKDDSINLLKMLHHNSNNHSNTSSPQRNHIELNQQHDATIDGHSQNLLNLLKNRTPDEPAMQTNILPAHHHQFVPSHIPSVHTDNEEVFEDSSMEEDEADSITPSIPPPSNKRRNIKFEPTPELEPSPEEGNETEETEENYSNFEDSTDSEGEGEEFKSAYENIPPPETPSELESEQLEVLNENEDPSVEAIPEEILRENAFNDGEVPHEEIKTESIKSMNSLSVNTSNTNIAAINPVNVKPKFKILRRGEKIEDLTKPSQSPIPTTEPVFNVPTHNMPVDQSIQHQQQKQPVSSSMDSGQDLLSILKSKSQANEEIPHQRVRKTSLQKSEETKNELLDLLKKNAEVIPESPETNKTVSHPHELLATLKEPRVQNVDSNSNIINNDTFHNQNFYQNNQGHIFNESAIYSNSSISPTSPPPNNAMMSPPNNELLQMLHGKNIQHSQMTSPNMEQQHLTTQMPPPSPPLENQSTSLLNMLKNPSHNSMNQQPQQMQYQQQYQQMPQQMQYNQQQMQYQQLHHRQQQQQQQQQPMPNTDGSSQLLNILHRK